MPPSVLSSSPLNPHPWQAIEELSRSPTLYDDLATALAPSVWQLEDVKRGVLLQLFGGTHKKLDAESTGECQWQ